MVKYICNKCSKEEIQYKEDETNEISINSFNGKGELCNKCSDENQKLRAKLNEEHKLKLSKLTV